MKKGNSRIIFPLDVDSAAEAEELVRMLDQKVGMFKIGLELFIDQGPAIVKRVRALSDAGIFLDLKLHDISATVKKAMESAVRTGADLVTVHASSSQKMLDMAVQGGQGKTRVLGVTLLTDNDASVVEACGFRDEYVARTERLVLRRAGFAHSAGCAGVVCSGLRRLRSRKPMAGSSSRSRRVSGRPGERLKMMIRNESRPLPWPSGRGRILLWWAGPSGPQRIPVPQLI